MAGRGAQTGLGDWLTDAWDSITGVAGSVVDGLSLASDPLGFTFAKAQQAVDGLVSQLLPWLMTATKPDLTLDWFLTQYQISFGIAVLVWLLILLGRLVAVARGNASGGDLIELLTTRSMTFIAGAMWGPAVGWMIVGIFHALSEGLLALIGSSAEGALASLLELIRDGDWLAVPGGLFFGIGLMITMLISLTLVVGMLIIAMVALYMSGVIFPLGWVWVTDDPSRRPIAYKIAWTWLGLNVAHPLMFLLLGASFALIAGMVPMSTDHGIKLFTHSLMAVVVMIMTALSPVMLFKFAAVLPTNAGQSGPSLNIGGGGGGKQGAPSNNMHEAIDNNPSNADDSGSASTGGGATSNGGGAGESSEPSAGPLEQAAMNSPSSADDSSTGGASSGGDSAAPADGHDASGTDPASSGDPGAGGPEDAPGAGEEPGQGAGGLNGSTPIGPASTSDAAGQGAVGESSAAGSAGAAETAGVAGAAETATGVGAVVGIPTLIAAAGMAAASKGVEAGEQGAGMAASDMDEQGDSQ